MKNFLPFVFLLAQFWSCDNATEDDSAGPELQDIMDETLASYQNPEIIDTSFSWNNDTVRVQIRHACKMDSAITVPKLYIEMFGLEKFVTHNFVSSVSISGKNGTILKREFNKSDFDAVLDDRLKEYAALVSPNFAASGDSIEFRYSITIPLTDVGIGVAAVVRPDGAVSFRRN